MSPRTVMLMEILDDGQLLQMNDGSSWMPTPGDMPTSSTWTPTSMIAIRQADEDEMFPYVFTHESNNISIRASNIT